jgi:uncharacterized protein (DUF1330 family)
LEYLIIVETNITNPAWVNDYLVKVTPMVSSHGGRYITRTQNIDLLEGDKAPQFSLVAEFPTKEAALSFYNSEEYQPFKESRQEGSSSKFLLVPVENGTA